MRFFADGPNIPDELLAAQERGEVLFLCGAGVSMPAGLPSFLKLTALAMKRLGVRADDPDRQRVEQALAGDDTVILPPLDALFERLKRDYGDAQVEALVTKLLRVPRGADLSLHKAVLDLSRDRHGKTRLVTTNFDPCFESAGGRKTPIHCAPHLPEFHDGYPLEGLVYMHGRASTLRGRPAPPGLVLGASDFGRAYLAQGWATRFVRAALERYTVVLLGYSADDPPINYLLQGLRSLQSSAVKPIYAFAESSRPEAVARWRDRRVNAIAYERRDSKHSGLWDALKAWAQRARDQDAWRASVLDLAAQNPRTLAPFQRGQVASLVKSEAGALAFATAKPAPPAEWLCVFDAALRYAPKHTLSLGGEETFDPLDAYGLDDDPPRTKPKSSHEPAPTGVDLLAANASDARHGEAGRLSGGWSITPNNLPPRLGYLGGWIAASWQSPATIWWAAGKNRLHPDLMQRIDVAMMQTKAEAQQVRRAWGLVRETNAEPSADRHWLWHNLADEIERDGWTPPVLRAFAQIIRPRLTMSRNFWNGFAPAMKAESQNRVADAISFKLSWFAPPLSKPPEDAGALAGLVREVGEALRYGTDLHADVRTSLERRTPSLHAERRRGERALSDDDKFFVWFARLFEALIKLDPKAAQAELTAWPATDNPWFDKLRVWAWEKASLASAATVTDGVLALTQRAFWDRHLQRELLFTLKARWRDFSEVDRQRIETRILAGPYRYRSEEDEEFATRQARDAVVLLDWLEQEGCALSPETAAERDRLKAGLPAWRDSWVATAADSMETQVHWVGTNEDFAHVRDLPFSQITARCAETDGERDITSYTRLDPFLGLTKQVPLIALAALTADARRGQHPVRYWRTILQSWPEKESARASFVLGLRMSRLPPAVLVELKHQAPDWLKKFWAAIESYRPHAPMMMWDAVFAPFALGDGADSGLESITAAGVPVEDVANSLDAAINAPVGTLTQCLLDMIEARKLKHAGKIPEPFAKRLSACLGVPGIGGAHAAAVTAPQLRWLHFIDPEWTVREIVPRLDLRHPHAKAAWDGLLYEDQLPTQELFLLIKPAFLAALKDAALWRGRDGVRQLGRILCVAIAASKPKRVYVSHAEGRAALQTTTAEVREAALEHLSYAMERPQGWKRFGRPFLEEVWPLELAMQTQETAMAWARIASETGADFPDAVRRLNASPALIQVDQLDSFVWSMTQPQRDGASLAAAHPRAVIDLLIPLVGGRARQIYDLRKLLDTLRAADPTLRDDEQFRKLGGDGPQFGQ